MFSQFDVAHLKAKAEKLIKNTGNSIVKMIPESMSPDKQFVNAISVTCALITVADKKIEVTEVEVMLNLIKDIKQIEDIGLTHQAIATYQEHVLAIEAMLNNRNSGTDPMALYALEKSKLLSEIALIKGRTEHVTMLENLMSYIMKACGKLDPEEIRVRNEILGVIK